MIPSMKLLAVGEARVFILDEIKTHKDQTVKTTPPSVDPGKVQTSGHLLCPSHMEAELDASAEDKETASSDPMSVGELKKPLDLQDYTSAVDLAASQLV